MTARGLPLMLLLAATLGGTGCFWLEPIEAIAILDPDGERPDAGTPDAGLPDAGLPGCEPGGPVPDGIGLLGFEPVQLDLLDDSPDQTVKLSLTSGPETPVWVALAATPAGIVTPRSAGVCFLAGETTKDVELLVEGGVGQTAVHASLANDDQAILAVNVRDASPPRLAGLSPRRRIVARGEQVLMTLSLDREAVDATVVTLSAVSSAVTVPASVEVAPGSSSATFTAQVAGGAGTETVAVYAELEGLATLAELRIGGPVISEVRIADQGFVELHNPTGTTIDVSGWRVQFRKFNDRDGFALATLPGGTSMAPGGYLLLALTNAYVGARDGVIDNGNSALGRSSMRVRLRDTQPEDVDQIYLGGGELDLPLDFSLERKAWSDATAESMSTGAHATSGNGWDSGQNGDFVVRTVPDPQHLGSTAELLQ